MVGETVMKEGFLDAEKEVDKGTDRGHCAVLGTGEWHGDVGSGAKSDEVAAGQEQTAGRVGDVGIVESVHGDRRGVNVDEVAIASCGPQLQSFNIGCSKSHSKKVKMRKKVPAQGLSPPILAPSPMDETYFSTVTSTKNYVMSSAINTSKRKCPEISLLDEEGLDVDVSLKKRHLLCQDQAVVQVMEVGCVQPREEQ